MRNNVPLTLHYRPLLTETLPYEVPLIFSNDRFYFGLCAPMSPEVNVVVQKIFKLFNSFTIPYNYTIAKDATRETTLSIVHPLAQRRIALFYEQHSQSVLQYCDRSHFSLRRPSATASPYSQKVSVDADDQFKLGLVDAVRNDGQPDVSHISSYFMYQKYNLFGKFMDSREFIRLESKFSISRTTDISKCFYNIYTHSISWAVKNKAIAKEFRNFPNFENEFDELMQACNYKETNGIVVGPEFSRIFAEIILQSVDIEVRKKAAADELTASIHYDIRRYVDDYIIFANNPVVLDKIEGILRKELEFYKLFLNSKKTVDARRPFVSDITLARNELGPLLRSLRTKLEDFAKAPKDHMRLAGDFKSQIRSVRVIVAKYEIAFSNLSGWLMSILRKNTAFAISLLKNQELTDYKPYICDVITTILEIAFYICALDTRVRTTYSICQIGMLIKEAFGSMPEEQVDTIQHLILDETISLIKSVESRRNEEKNNADSVELFNLLIFGAFIVGEDFIRSSYVKSLLHARSTAGPLSYFTYATCKFCYQVSAEAHAIEIKLLENRAKLKILSQNSDISRESEHFMLFCDFIGDELIDVKDRMTVFKSKVPGDIPKQVFEDVASRMGFIDWTGISVKHLLRRKELRPVYAWR